VISEDGGPLSGGVKDAKDFNGVCADAIGNDVGCVGNDQLARGGNPAGAAHGGISGEQVNGAQNSFYETAGRGWTSLS
jgi:hypothetical protein